MIRVQIRPRLLKTARKLSADEIAQVNATITSVQRCFGQPHLHGGIGLRKLGRKSYEARIGLTYRIVFIFENGELIAHDIMDHEGGRHWLKSRRGE